MSKLVLLEYNNSLRTDNGAPNYKRSMYALQGEKVFIYKKSVSAAFDETNRNIVLKHFGLAKTYKRNSMAVNHTNAINDGKNQVNFNDDRLSGINKLNLDIADFFLKNLHELTWDNYEQGVLSTIPFNEAFDLLVPAMKQLYEILAAGIEDKYSKDLSVAEMKNVLEKHNLLVEQTLGKNIPNKN